MTAATALHTTPHETELVLSFPHMVPVVVPLPSNIMWHDTELTHWTLPQNLVIHCCMAHGMRSECAQALALT